MCKTLNVQRDNVGFFSQTAILISIVVNVAMQSRHPSGLNMLLNETLIHILCDLLQFAIWNLHGFTNRPEWQYRYFTCCLYVIFGELYGACVASRLIIGIDGKVHFSFFRELPPINCPCWQLRD